MKLNCVLEGPANCSQYETYNLLSSNGTLVLKLNIFGLTDPKLLKNLSYIAVIHMIIPDQ